MSLQIKDALSYLIGGHSKSDVLGELFLVGLLVIL